MATLNVAFYAVYYKIDQILLVVISKKYNNFSRFVNAVCKSFQ